MAKDKKEEVNFKEMYGKAATLSVEQIMREQNINLERRIVDETG